MNKKLKMQFITFKKLPLLPFLEGLSDLAFDVIPKDSTTGIRVYDENDCEVYLSTGTEGRDVNGLTEFIYGSFVYGVIGCGNTITHIINAFELEVDSGGEV